MNFNHTVNFGIFRDILQLVYLLCDDCEEAFGCLITSSSDELNYVRIQMADMAICFNRICDSSA